jgi:translation initiation factor IF-1
MTTGQEQPDDRCGRDANQITVGSEQASVVRATVLESLTNGLFRLQMTDGRPLVAHVAKDLRMALSRLLPGDPVLVDVSPFDPGKARICKLLTQ